MLHATGAWAVRRVKVVSRCLGALQLRVLQPVNVLAGVSDTRQKVGARCIFALDAVYDLSGLARDAYSINHFCYDVIR